MIRALDHKKFVAIAVFLLAVVQWNVVFAQFKEKSALVERIILAPAYQAHLDDNFSKNALRVQIDMFSPDLEPEIAERISILLEEEYRNIRPVLEREIIRNWAVFYTFEELNALIDFYETPIGKSILFKQQPVNLAVQDEVSPYLVEAIRKVRKQISEEFDLK